MFVLTSFVRALRFIAAYAIANIQSAMEYRICYIKRTRTCIQVRFLLFLVHP